MWSSANFVAKLNLYEPRFSLVIILEMRIVFLTSQLNFVATTHNNLVPQFTMEKTWERSYTHNGPFTNCCEPHYESEVKCKAFHMKISFVCIWMKTNFYNKNFELGLAFIVRFKATQKWRITQLTWKKKKKKKKKDPVNSCTHFVMVVK